MLHYITLHYIYITLHYRHFKRHLQWPVVHQQLHVIRNTAHRPSTQASYTASLVRPKWEISCAAAQIAATLIPSIAPYEFNVLLRTTTDEFNVLPRTRTLTYNVLLLEIIEKDVPDWALHFPYNYHRFSVPTIFYSKGFGDNQVIFLHFNICESGGTSRPLLIGHSVGRWLSRCRICGWSLPKCDRQVWVQERSGSFQCVLHTAGENCGIDLSIMYTCRYTPVKKNT